MPIASASSGRKLSMESMSSHGADGGDDALTSEEWTDAQIILTSAHGEFGKYEKQISGLLSEVGCGNKEDHMFVKLTLILVIKIHVDLLLLSAAIPVSFCFLVSCPKHSNFRKKLKQTVDSMRSKIDTINTLQDLFLYCKLYVKTTRPSYSLQLVMR